MQHMAAYQAGSGLSKLLGDDRRDRQTRHSTGRDPRRPQNTRLCVLPPPPFLSIRFGAARLPLPPREEHSQPGGHANSTRWGKRAGPMRHSGLQWTPTSLRPPPHRWPPRNTPLPAGQPACLPHRHKPLPAAPHRRQSRHKQGAQAAHAGRAGHAVVRRPLTTFHESDSPSSSVAACAAHQSFSSAFTQLSGSCCPVQAGPASMSHTYHSGSYTTCCPPKPPVAAETFSRRAAGWGR